MKAIHGWMTWVAVMIIVSTSSAQLRYEGPRDDDSFFPIGWSQNGRLVAYGWFETTQMISNGSRIMIKVQDVVTDKVIYQHGKTWDEGNAGPGLEEYYPTSARRAWEIISDHVNPKLLELGIQPGAGAGVQSFPMEEDPFIRIEIRGYQEPGHSIWAGADTLGEKRISGGESEPDNINIQGYLWNPQGTRIAVVINTLDFNMPYSDFKIVGCHISSGFSTPH